MIRISAEMPDMLDFKKNVFPRLVTDSLIASGEAWKKKQLPKRFKTGADRKFGLPPRTKLYMIRKAKVKGHQRTLVWNGLLERTAKGGATVKGNIRTVRVKIRIPMTADSQGTRRRHTGGITIRQQLQILVAEDYALQAQVTQAEVKRRSESDPKYRIKRKRARVIK